MLSLAPAFSFFSMSSPSITTTHKSSKRPGTLWLNQLGLKYNGAEKYCLGCFFAHVIQGVGTQVKMYFVNPRQEIRVTCGQVFKEGGA